MIDAMRVQRPLEEAAEAMARLDEYQTAAELASALQTTARAVDRTLRNLLRSDPGTPDELRLAAFAPAELSSDQLIHALRQRELISLQLAGMVHELEQAASRAERGEVRAADGDRAQQVVERLRTELATAADLPLRAAAHHAVESGLIEQPARSVPRAGRVRPLLQMAALAAIIILTVVLAVMLTFRQTELEKGIAALQAERWAAAETHFERAARDRSNATAQVYLARVYRRQQEYERAADVLREAARTHEQDDAVWRELGYLFLDLQQPEFAVERFRRAQELNPDASLNWIGLVRALREAGDSAQAEQVLQRAPVDVRAALTRDAG